MSVGVLGINARCQLSLWQSFFLVSNPTEDQDIASVTYLNILVTYLKTFVVSRSEHLPPFDLHDQYYCQLSALKTAVPAFSGAAGRPLTHTPRHLVMV
jgi:hypothetical protein